MENGTQKEHAETALDVAALAPDASVSVVMEESDALKLERYDLIGENMQLKWAAFSREVSDVVTAIRKKYAMGTEDTFDLASRRVRRKAP
jgi:hypothetical protein